MPRVTGPSGVVVSVSDEKAARLGPAWAVVADEADEPKQAPAKRTASKK